MEYVQKVNVVDQRIRYVIFTEEANGETFWIAQALEYDICTSAPSRGEVIDRMGDLIHVEIEQMLQMRKSLKRAPEKFWVMFDEADVYHKSAILTSRELHVRVPPIAEFMERLKELHHDVASVVGSEECFERGIGLKWALQLAEEVFGSMDKV